MDLPDTTTHRNRREIASKTSTRRYILSQRISTGAWECSCPGWKTHRKCKHLPSSPAQRREHWMCNRCQNIHCPWHALLDPRLRNTALNICCWCGQVKTTLAAPDDAVIPPCQDVHLEDVM